MHYTNFIDFRDIAAECLLFLEDPRADGQVFNIGTGQRVSILQLAEILIDLSGQRLKPEIVYRYRKGDIRHCFSDITAARKLGFSPAIPLHEGLRHLYAWAKTIDDLDLVQVSHYVYVNRCLLGRKSGNTW